MDELASGSASGAVCVMSCTVRPYVVSTVSSPASQVSWSVSVAVRRSAGGCAGARRVSWQMAWFCLACRACFCKHVVCRVLRVQDPCASCFGSLAYTLSIMSSNVSRRGGCLCGIHRMDVPEERPRECPGRHTPLAETNGTARSEGRYNDFRNAG
jgi:hypothetical protein